MRLAAVDVGTNTARLLVAELAGGRVLDLERRAVVVGLGTGVDASGRISEAAIERTVALLGEYRALMTGHRVERFRAVATSATRDAANASQFLDRATEVLGTRPEVIGGPEEAALSFQGAIAGLPGPGPTLVIDVGGGSTEFVVGDDAPLAATSIDIGSVRLTERLLVERPATDEEVAAATDLARRMFAPVAIPGPPVRAIGVAGTFTSLAAIHLGLASYDLARVHGSTLTVADLDHLVATLSPLTIEETAAIPSLQSDRAPVLLGGAVVVREAVRRCGLGRVTVSETDLLDGIVLGLAG